MGAISQDTSAKLARKIPLKFHSNLPGSNELIPVLPHTYIKEATSHGKCCPMWVACLKIHTSWDNMADIFKSIFLNERKCVYFDPNFTDVCSQGSNWQYINSGSGAGLLLNWQQAISCTHDDLIALTPYSHWATISWNISQQNIANRADSSREGGHLNIKIPSYHCRDPHVKDKTSHDRLIFNLGIPIPGKDGLYIVTRPRSFLSSKSHLHLPFLVFFQFCIIMNNFTTLRLFC